MSQPSKKQATLEQAGFDRGRNSPGGTGARTPQAPNKAPGNKQGTSTVTPGSPAAHKGKKNKGRQGGGTTRKSSRGNRGNDKAVGNQTDKDKSLRRSHGHGKGKQQGGSASGSSNQSGTVRTKDKGSKNKLQARKQGGQARRQHQCNATQRFTN